jgi:hypothetical protein
MKLGRGRSGLCVMILLIGMMVFAGYLVVTRNVTAAPKDIKIALVYPLSDGSGSKGSNGLGE